MASHQTATIGVQLQGQMQVTSGLNSISRSLRNVAMSVEGADVATNRYQRRGFLMNQALFTMRRALYGASIAATAFFGAGIKMGFQFNSSMEQNTIAMTQFLGSASAARTELSHLYQVAAVTPFEFGNIVDTTRRFLAFGFSLKETNRMLGVMGDTAAAMGGGVDTLQRMALVFGQMHAAGRVLGQDMLQLEQIGLPVLDILKEQLGLTQKQVANIGQLQIPADIAIEAIMRGLNERFQGQAAKQAKTLQGQLSTLHDYAQKLFGAMTLPLFHMLEQRVIPALSSVAQDMTKAMQEHGFMAALQVLDQRIGANGKLMWMVHHLYDLLQNFGKLMKNVVIPVTIFWLKALSPLLAVIPILSFFMYEMSKHSTTFKIVLTILVGLMIGYRIALIAAAIAQFRLAMMEALTYRNTTRLTFAQYLARMGLWAYYFAYGRLLILMRSKWVVALVQQLKNWKAWATAMGQTRSTLGTFMQKSYLAQGVLARLSRFILLTVIPTFVELWAVIWPIGLAILIIGGLTLLYFKWRWFHNLVNDTIHWLLDHKWVMVAFFFTPLGPIMELILAVDFLKRHFNDLIGVVKTAYDWMNKTAGKVPGGWRTIVGFAAGGPLGVLGVQGLHQINKRTGHHIPGAQAGGWIASPGSLLVGEQGPEVLNLPRGASVAPLHGGAALGGPLGGIRQQLADSSDRPIHIQLVVDRKVLAQAVYRAKQDQGARA